MIDNEKIYNVAIWAITPKGADIARKIAESLPSAHLFLSENLGQKDISFRTFEILSETLSQVFNTYQGHIFIMSTGIVVRLTAPLIRHKTVDPAVIVVDEMGHHAISLLSGHIGGANKLAKNVARHIGADPVITTATDKNRVPAIDILAIEKDLYIENPDAIKGVNMAFLTGRKISFHDPFGLLIGSIPESCTSIDTDNHHEGMRNTFLEKIPGVFIDDVLFDLPPQVLILRPRSLVAGMGCNRNTGLEEMRSFLNETLVKSSLSSHSLYGIATINIKADELGLLALSKDLELPINFYDKEELKQIKNITTPSSMVEKHIGVKSICEAAAILASNRGKLIVPKQSTRNVTVAIARKSYTS